MIQNTMTSTFVIGLKGTKGDFLANSCEFFMITSLSTRVGLGLESLCTRMPLPSRHPFNPVARGP